MDVGTQADRITVEISETFVHFDTQCLAFHRWTDDAHLLQTV